MGMTIDEHKEHLLDIMDSMPDDACSDWRDSLAYAIETMRKYQKITKILNSASYTENGTVYSYTYDEDTRVRHIREVIND